MRLLLILLIAAAIAAALSAFAIEDPGIALLMWGDYTVRLSLALLAVLILLAFALSYLLIGALQVLFSVPQRLRDWSSVRHERKVWQHITQGYLALLAGQTPKAEKLLDEAGQSSVLSGLGAAAAAAYLEAPNRMARHLETARQQHAEHAWLIDLAEARLALQADDAKSAQPILARLIEKHPNNPLIAKLLAQACVSRKDWPTLLKLMPTLEKLQALPKARLQATAAAAYRGYFQAHPKPAEAWNKLAGKTRRRPAAIAGFAARLLADKQTAEAEQALAQGIHALPSAPDKAELQRLTNLYAELGGADRGRTRKIENWLKRFPDDPGLLLALARAHWRADNPKAARATYQRLAEQAPAGSARLEWAQMEEALGDLAAALKCHHAYHKAQSGD